ncbi:S-layer homology domain-containing protein [Agathobaculum sp.]|uniref:S-layer homology domain-containing protein n=1 Tax=Agathobaculum sp. TaxID=2048138 RepID=UPI002A80765E|nr:S-layer homology domain-containing protein [Agathobaculum sp.]MDY3617402.1 S-layer homology domain-containing protein [Agathobaculum sp.]
MLKKMIAVCGVLFTLLFAASAAEPVFPASRTGMDGETKYGYLDESGRTVLPFAYAGAGEFADCGLAAVEDNKWQTALIDRQGNLIVPYTDAPVSVEFSDDAAAYRYAGHSVYYTLAGEKIGSYPGAVGFFSDGLLLCRSEASGLYRYVTADGQPAFEGEFRQAGVFSGGRALVQTEQGAYLAIDTKGETLFTVDEDITPSYMTIFDNDTIVLYNGTNQALYSLSEGRYVTDFLYHNISEFHDGVAMVRQVNRWGIMDTAGRMRTEPTYYYLSYMGDGLYAARSQDGSAAAVDADGNVIYRTPSYVGGFAELKYGLSWHGMADGSIIFFRRNGGYFASLKNAENPKLLSENVVRVTQDGQKRYINLATGATLFAQPLSFDLGQGITANTVHYEKFLGYQKDGSEHGWNVDFPEIAGLPDADVQKKINNSIREFFLKGPSVTAEYEALEGSYGVSLEGSVLVVWANCVSGKGAGSSVWNSNLAFDVRTGAAYQITDLMQADYIETVKALLPEGREIYMYSFPRMSQKGVTYFYNEYESETRRAHTESFLLTFEQLGSAVDRESAAFAALHTVYQRPQVSPADALTDISGHWAEDLIRQAADSGLVQGGKDGRFRPDDAITAAEVCATVARSKKLPETDFRMPGIAQGLWYTDEVNKVYAAGLLEGLTETFSADAPMTREDAMQLFANVLMQSDKTLPDDTETASLLAAFADADTLSADRRAAAALCVREGLIKGSGGKLLPAQSFTRAEFVKLLLLI